MNRYSRSTAILPWLVLCVLACSAGEPETADLRERVDEELTRLRAVSEEIDRNSLPESIGGRLESATDQLEDIRPLDSTNLQLYELRDPFVRIETVDFLVAHRPASSSIEDLETLWEEQKPKFQNVRNERSGSLRDALIEVAATRSERLFNASLQYGRISSPSSGLYYLAQAEGNRRFLDFLDGLPAPEGRIDPPERDVLLATADRIESSAIEVFNEAPTGREMIPVSVSLDEAREMIEKERLAGATLELLEARLRLSLKTESRSISPLSSGTAEGAVDSIRSLLEAMASRSDQNEIATIAESVLLPLYDSMRAGIEPVSRTASPDVTLTLVRWPYT